MQVTRVRHPRRPPARLGGGAAHRCRPSRPQPGEARTLSVDAPTRCSTPAPSPSRSTAGTSGRARSRPCGRATPSSRCSSTDREEADTPLFEAQACRVASTRVASRAARSSACCPARPATRPSSPKVAARSASTSSSVPRRTSSSRSVASSRCSPPSSSSRPREHRHHTRRPAPRPDTDTPMTVRLVDRLGRALGGPGLSRRRFLSRVAVVGAAVAVDPIRYAVKPGSAYAQVCGDGASCGSGWTAFCCTVNAGANTCPPGSYVAGWWRIDDSPFCFGAARYVIDCNRSPNASCSCRCADGACDKRRVCCNNFRYGQCNTQIRGVTEVVCRVVTCTAPWVWDSACSTHRAGRQPNPVAQRLLPTGTQRHPDRHQVPGHGDAGFDPRRPGRRRARRRPAVGTAATRTGPSTTGPRRARSPSTARSTSTSATRWVASTGCSATRRRSRRAPG